MIRIPNLFIILTTFALCAAPFASAQVENPANSIDNSLLSALDFFEAPLKLAQVGAPADAIDDPAPPLDSEEGVLSGAPKANEARRFFTYTTFHSEDGSDWDAGFKWDLKWDNTFGETADAWGYYNLETTGAYAVGKPELNQNAIVVQGKFGGYKTLVPAIDNTPSIHDNRDDPTAGALGGDDSQSRRSIGLIYGFNGKYEMDQARDHSNGAFSGYLGIGNANSRNAWALLPSLYASIDAVVPDRNATAEAMTMGEIGTYGRFSAAADWYVRFDWFGPEFLEPFSFHGALEYTRAFGNAPAAIEETEQDESFGAVLELLYKFDDGFRETGEHELPKWFYLQYSTGNRAPLPEDEQRLMFGVRYKF